MAISTVSINNTPQANSDTYTRTEDEVSGIYSFDVMSNDLGGNAKILWSLDNTATDGSADLIASDIGECIANTDDTSLNGAKICIENGKVRYDTASLNSSFLAYIGALAAGESLTDSFTYAIRMANGTLAWTTAYVVYNGRNDNVVITSALHGGSVDEDAGASIGGTIAFTDVDASDTHTAQITGSPASTLGTFTLGTVSEAATAQNGTIGWTYTVNTAAAQYLAAGESVVETYTVTVDDTHGGSTTTTVTVTVTGENDGVSIGGGIVAGTVLEESGDYQESGSFAFGDVDLSDEHSVTFSPGGSGYLGTFSAGLNNDSTGDGSGQVDWSFSVGNSALQFLGEDESVTQNYTVTVDDGEGGSATQTITITLTGVNDGPQISVGAGDSDGATLTESDSGQSYSETLTVTDPDTSDTVTLDVTGVSADGRVNGLSEAALEAMLTTDATDAADPGSANNLGWTFNSGAEAFDYLADGESLVLAYTVQATDDEGETDTQTVTITIVGTNDAAVITGTASDSVIEAGGVLNGTAGDASASGDLNATDVDSSAAFQLQTNAAKTYGSFTIDATGAWSYTLDDNNAAVQALNAGGATLTDTITVATADGTTATVTVTINGRNDAAVITGDAAGSVTEDAADNDDSGDLDSTDVDNADDAWNAASGDALYGSYAIDADGVWTYTVDNTNGDVDALNAGDSLADSFTVATADGTSTTVTVTINGRNDAAVITGDTSGTVDEDQVPNTATGNLASTDVDNADDAWNAVATAAATANGYGTFTMTAAGVWTYTLDNSNPDVNALVGSATLSDSFSVTTVDGTSQTVTVTITASNDAATITADAGGDYAVTESGGVGEGTPGDPDAAGQVSVSDVDTGQARFQTPAAGSLNGLYGSFTFDSLTGAWTYTLANAESLTNELNDGQSQTDTLTVTSLDGTDSHDIVVVITGTNDASYITGNISGEVTEAGEDGAGYPLAEGSLSSQDVDNPDEEFVSEYDPVASDSGYGTYTVSNLGNWDYNLDNDNADVEALNNGDTLTDTFTVYSIDNTPQQVTITIWGDNDEAFIAGDDVGEVTEATSSNAGTPQASGTLTAADVDNPDDTFNADADGTTYGSFEIDADGNWTYTLDNDNAAVDALGNGGSLIDTFVVSSVDGTTHTVSVKINGADDVAPLTANRDVIIVSTSTGSLAAPIFIPASWLLANDTDADNDTLVITSMGAMTALPSGWTFAPVMSGGVVIGFNVSTGNGTDVSLDIGYTIIDGDGNESTVISTIITPTAGNQSTPGANTINLNGIEYNYSYIDGLAQRDTITGGSTTPITLEGGVGNDAFVGSAGDDILDAGGGHNLLTGGADNDDFIFRDFAGMTNHITDFNAGTSTNTAATAVDQILFDVGVGANMFSVGDNDTAIEAGELFINNTTVFANTAAVQAYIDAQSVGQGAFFVVFNAELGNAAVYYDSNPSAAGGATLVTEIDNVTTLAGMNNFNSGDFIFV